MKTGEIEEVLALVREFAAQDATIIHGVAFDDSMGADIKVTIVTTGLGGSASKKMPKIPLNLNRLNPSSRSQIFLILLGKLKKFRLVI